jgi:hypothetical protein
MIQQTITIPTQNNDTITIPTQNNDTTNNNNTNIK